MSSMRSRRMARNHKRMAKPAKLNLVALMDIFTILVLFLIVNNGDVEVLQSDKNIVLPESVSEQRPEATLMVKITDTDILLDDRRIAGIDEVLAESENTIAALERELFAATAAAAPLTPKQNELGRSIVIMGDEEMPYKLLKRIMATCAATDYRDISLAVNSNPAVVTASDLQQVASAEASL